MRFTASLCLFLLVLLSVRVSAQVPSTANPGWVVLPVSEYNALKRAAVPTDPEPSLPPVEATLSRIDYDLKIDGDLASGEARLTVDVIKHGWVRVPMPEGLIVRDAQLDGRPVNLVTRPKEKGPGGLDLLLSKPGRSVLTLKIVAPVTTVAGTNILHLPVSNSAVSQATVELMRQGVDVRVTGGLLLEHSEAPTGSRWKANGKGGEPLSFAWRRRVDDARANQPLRLRGAVTQVVGLGEDVTQVNAEVQLEVVQGLALNAIVQLPDQFNVNQVSGAMVADWDVTNRELKVTFIEPVTNTTRFMVTGELRLPRDGKVDVLFIAIEPVRAAEVEFTPPYVLIEGAYLVPKDSVAREPADLDQPGKRISVGENSAYDLYLKRTLKHATLVRTAGGCCKNIELFLADKLDAAAGVRQPLAAYAKDHPDVRVLEKAFQQIRQAMGTPKGRTAAAAYLRTFIEEMKTNGFVADALKRSNQEDAQVAPPGG